MSRIKMQSDGKRPNFFPESGADQTISMIMELMSEVWVMRERMYVLEKVAGEAGLDLTAGIENWQAEESERLELSQARAQLIQSVTRSLAANNVPGLHLRRALDEENASDDDGGNDTASPVRAA